MLKDIFLSGVLFPAPVYSLSLIHIYMSYQEQKIQNGIGIVQIFLLSSCFVFLILAALYERWSLPLLSLIHS